MNIYTNIFNKIIAILNWQYIKSITHFKRHLTKSYLFKIQTFGKLGIKRNFLNLIKDIIGNFVAGIILNNKAVFSLRLGAKQGC